MIGGDIASLDCHEVAILVVNPTYGIQLTIKYRRTNKFPGNDHGSKLVPVSCAAVVALDITKDVSTI